MAWGTCKYKIGQPWPRAPKTLLLTHSHLVECVQVFRPSCSHPTERPSHLVVLVVGVRQNKRKSFSRWLKFEKKSRQFRFAHQKFQNTCHFWSQNWKLKQDKLWQKEQDLMHIFIDSIQVNWWLDFHRIYHCVNRIFLWLAFVICRAIIFIPRDRTTMMLPTAACRVIDDLIRYVFMAML